MRCSLSSHQFAAGLSAVARVVSPRATLPILSNVLIEARDGAVHLLATNLDLTIRHQLPAKIDEPGSITLPAKILSEFVAALPDGPMEWQLDATSQTVALRSGPYTAHIRGIDAAEFPPLPVLDGGARVPLDPITFATATEQTVVAASVDEGRPLYTGVLTELADSILTLVATDGHRLAIRQLGVPGTVAGAKTSVIVPARALAELGRLLRPQGGDSPGPLALHLSQNGTQVTFELPGYELTTRLLEGTYPNYSKVVPEGAQTTIRTNTKEFLRTTRVVALFARDAANVVKIRSDPGMLTLSANTNEVGDNVATMPATIDGEQLAIAFNARYLLDVLQILQTEEVELVCNGSLAPGLIRPVGDDSYRYVIMPVRVAL